MFGYIVTDKPQLRICEYEAYRSVYCSLCKNISKNYGLHMTVTLNYDFTFLALLGYALTDNDCTFEKKRCVCNPFKSCGYCKCNEQIMDFASAAAMITVYYKLLDNIEDSPVFKKIAFYILKPIAKIAFKKASKKYPELAKVIKNEMNLSFQNEKDESCTLDRAADPTAKMLSYMFAGVTGDVINKRILDRLGYCLGRWIYLMDAADDIEEDAKNGNFNPLIKNKKRTKTADETTALLNMNISEAVNCLELLEFKRFKDIIYNIICLGMPKTQDRVLKEFRKD